MSKEYYETLVRQRGLQTAFNIAVDDVEKARIAGAAAPELLAVVERFIKDFATDELAYDLMVQARAAIAKAKGE